MGRRGPAPKPTALKVAQGNPGKRTLRDDEPVPPLGAIEPPKWVSAGGRRIWAAIAPVAMKMKTLTTADLSSFGRYCETFSRWIRVNQQLAEKKTAKKADVWLWQEERKLTKDLLLFEREFGLTASARTRIQVDMGAGGSAPVPQSDAVQSFRDEFMRPLPFKAG